MADDMNNLDQGLGDYYRSRCLGPDRIAAIEASVLRTRRIERVARRSALAVAVSVAIIAAVWLRPESGADRTRQIVAEIARNHLEPGRLAVESDQYSVVEEALRELEFPIRPDREGLVATFGLVGGRYCSILGSPAAQLQMVHRQSGVAYSLYVVRMTDDMDNVGPGTYQQDGARVELWTGGESLYGLANRP